MWSKQYTAVDREAIQQDLHKYAFLFHRLSLDRNVVQFYPEVIWGLHGMICHVCPGIREVCTL